MPKLYVVRHAWAEERGAKPDALRELTPEGVRRWRRAASRLVEVGVQPATVASSPLARARQTAEILAEVAGASCIIENELSPGGDCSQVLRACRKLQSPIAMVGHCPDVEYFTAMLIGDGSAAIRFAKGAVAEIEFLVELAEGGGTLKRLITAKSLGV